MADAANKEEARPQFRLQKMYVKDFSFENPNAPEVFMAQENQEPRVELNMKINNRKINDQNWEVALQIKAEVVNKGDADKTLFIIEVEHAGMFYLNNIPDEHMNMVLAVDCPTMLFPFTRQIISQVSVDGGFVPFQMEPINFLALFQNSQKKQQEQS
ncbi:MAG: protein-export chaperone SecB [Deltaproteobacteria bacterium]|nr:MAG: protein-export chaperone SecB [Deltaproteobacteria bacterium]